MRVALFEDEKVRNFLPLTYMRSFFDLRTGLYTFKERASQIFGDIDLVYTRRYLEEYYIKDLGLKVNIPDVDDNLLLINPRYLLDHETIKNVKNLILKKRTFALFDGENLVSTLLLRDKVPEIVEHLINLSTSNIYVKLKQITDLFDTRATNSIIYPWELIEKNHELLISDIKSLAKKGTRGEIDETAKVLGKNEVYVAEKSIIEPYTVINTKKGPVYIDEGAIVHSFTYIEGPAYIGKNTIVMPGSIIREGTNIGEVCRVGGEIEASIIQAYSNKYHRGFLGHAYVGAWVNLGALTTNSDLKNTYGNIKVTINNKLVNTGKNKVGSFIGDMVKTSIGTLIYTGKKIGISSHLYGTVYEDVPSFTIYATSLGIEPVELKIESAIETQKRMMERRGKRMTDSLRKLITTLFYKTAEERKLFGVKAKLFKLK